MNGEVETAADDKAIEESMDTTSPPSSPAANPLSDTPAQTNSSLKNNNTEDSNHTENTESSQSDESDESQDGSTQSKAERPRSEGSRPIEENVEATNQESMNSNDSTSRTTSGSSQKNKPASAASAASSDNSDVEETIEDKASFPKDSQEELKDKPAQQGSERGSVESSDESGVESSGEESAENDEEPVSIHSDSASENGTDKDADRSSKKSRTSDIQIVDDLSNHEPENGSQSPKVHEIVSDNENENEASEATPDARKTTIEPKEETTPEPAEKKKEAAPALTPRRSSRAIKRKSYRENDEAEAAAVSRKAVSPDVQEVGADDPLHSKPFKSRPLFVNGTKKLIDLTAPSPQKAPAPHKKEPTVVIIDTNSFLAGKAPPPPKPYSSLASTLSQQSLYQSIAARGTTVTPVSMKQSAAPPAPASAPPPVPALTPLILPSLTDDMFVVEAPSFIVPYVYEKPSVEPFREFVDSIGKELEEQRKKEESERVEKEKLEREKKRKEEKEEEKKTPVEAHSEDKEKSSKDDDIREVLGLTKNDGKTDKTDKTDAGETDKKSAKEDRKDRKRRKEDDDASWDGDSSSDSDDEITDDDKPKTIIIKEKEDDSLDGIKDPILLPPATDESKEGKSDSYFDNPLGKFFMTIGVSLVQEYVQHDLLKQQKRKLAMENRSGHGNPRATESAITSLMKNLNFSKENNAPYKFTPKKCEFCSFKSESSLVMAHHMETPHMKNNIYKCNFCEFEIRSPHDILYHMEAEHKIRGRLERAPAYHQCVNCPFEDNAKGKLARHLIACAKKFKPDMNLAPPIEWEPPAKIPKIARVKNNAMSTYQAAFVRSQGPGARPQLSIGGTTIVGSGALPPAALAMFRGRGRPQPLPLPSPRNAAPLQGYSVGRGGVVVRHSSPQAMHSLPSNYNFMGTSVKAGAGAPGPKAAQQPSISITPLPRAPQPPSAAPPSAKGTFVICEICDGYIKDLEQLRNHMQWIHKVKIHPKMIHNRPPLNCQKCQFRFFTDQGLERHLLGSHGLVTSSMQEAANKGKDTGRCPVCGRVYQWKLLNHVARDHNMTLKPAHLSYKCTVCTATFGMYKQFENHVYSAHSVVAKRVMDKNKPASPAGTSSVLKANESGLKPLKINDEITIIPQPSKLASAPVVKPMSKGLSG